MVRALGADHRARRERGVRLRGRRGADQLVEPRGRGRRPALLRRASRAAGRSARSARSSSAWSERSPPGRRRGGSRHRRREREALRDELAALVLTQRATFATPVWLNAGLTERPLTSACFILKAEDSIPELLDWNTREGLIFQQGGGAGINLSPIRSSREPVSRGGLASGPVSFMRATDAWAATIRAGGRARRGAKMVVLDASHPDILEFIDGQGARGGPRPGAARRRISARGGGGLARVPARQPLGAGDRRVHAPGRRRRRVGASGGHDRRGARDAPRPPIAVAPAPRRPVRCGDPGLQFADQIARWHTCPNTGPVTASNPCGEFLHVADSACNLATLNLLAFLEGPRVRRRGLHRRGRAARARAGRDRRRLRLPERRDRAQRPSAAPDRDRLRQPRRAAALARDPLRLRRRAATGPRRSRR